MHEVFVYHLPAVSSPFRALLSLECLVHSEDHSIYPSILSSSSLSLPSSVLCLPTAHDMATLAPCSRTTQTIAAKSLATAASS